MIMANKGNRRHMSALASPRFTAIKRKERSYVAKPNPGRHTADRAVSLQLVLNKLGAADTSRKARAIIKNGQVSVNSKTVKVPYYPVGLGDIVAIQRGKAYRVFINKYAKVDLEEVGKPDYDSQVFKISGKYRTKKGQVMIRLHDGATIKAGNDVHVNDSVVVDLKNNIKRIFPLKAGAECVVVSGVHVGASGSIKALKQGNMRMEPSAVIKPKDGEEFETIVKNIMVTG